jgi:hypothetical protein
VALGSCFGDGRRSLPRPTPKHPADLPKIEEPYRSPPPPPKLRPWEEEPDDEG